MKIPNFIREEINRIIALRIKRFGNRKKESCYLSCEEGLFKITIEKVKL